MISRNVCVVLQILHMMVCLPPVVISHNVSNLTGPVLLFESYWFCVSFCSFEGMWKMFLVFMVTTLFLLSSFLSVYILDNYICDVIF